MTDQRRELVITPITAAEAEIGRMLWMLQDTRARTKEALDGLDPANVDLSPEPFENSINTLLYHLAVIEADWLYSEVLERDFPEEILSLFPEGVRDASGTLIQPRQRDLERHLQVLDEIRTLVLETYSSMSIEDFRRPRSLPQYEVTPEWALHHLMQHEAEHRGHIQTLRQAIETAARP